MIESGEMVRKGGFEPPRSCERQPLKLVRLPVPPLPHMRAEEIKLSAFSRQLKLDDLGCELAFQ